MFRALYYPLFPDIFVLELSATSLKTNWRFSQPLKFEFFDLVPESRTHTGLICINKKNTGAKYLKLGPLKEFSTNRQISAQFSTDKSIPVPNKFNLAKNLNGIILIRGFMKSSPPRWWAGSRADPPG